MTAVLAATSSRCVLRGGRRPEATGTVSYGPQVAEIARLLGTPFMPWQRQVADVALELLPDGSFAYREVIVTVPRQQGKTTMVLVARGLARECLCAARQTPAADLLLGPDRQGRSPEAPR